MRCRNKFSINLQLRGQPRSYTWFPFNRHTLIRMSNQNQGKCKGFYSSNHVVFKILLNHFLNGIEQK